MGAAGSESLIVAVPKIESKKKKSSCGFHSEREQDTSLCLNAGVKDAIKAQVWLLWLLWLLWRSISGHNAAFIVRPVSDFFPGLASSRAL